MQNVPSRNLWVHTCHIVPIPPYSRSLSFTSRVNYYIPRPSFSSVETRDKLNVRDAAEASQTSPHINASRQI